MATQSKPGLPGTWCPCNSVYLKVHFKALRKFSSKYCSNRNGSVIHPSCASLHFNILCTHQPPLILMSKLFRSGSIYNYINNLWERERERREREGQPVICSTVLIIASKCYCTAQNRGCPWKAFSGFSMSDGLLIWNTSWLKRLIFKPAVMLGGGGKDTETWLMFCRQSQRLAVSDKTTTSQCQTTTVPAVTLWISEDFIQ